MGNIGKILLIAGLSIATLGLVLIVSQRFGGLGRLPGDIVVERKNFTLSIPIVTCIILSVVMTLILWLFNGRR